MNPVDRARVATAAEGTSPGRRFLWDGLLGGRTENVPDVYTGRGAPTATYPTPTPRQGSLYLRLDGHAAASNIYKYDGGWFGIA